MKLGQALAKFALDLPRGVKRVIALLLDIFLCAIAVWASFYLRLGEWFYFTNPNWRLDYAFYFSALISIPIFVLTGFYRAIFRYSGWAALKTIFFSSAIYCVLYCLVFTFYGINGVPRTIGIIQPILLFFLVGGSRAIVGRWLGGIYIKRANLNITSRVLIYGAGAAGQQLVAALSGHQEIRIFGYVDDDSSLIGGVLGGLPIFGFEQITSIVDRYAITDIFLAIPSASRMRRNEIIKGLQGIKVAVRTLPSIVDIAKGRIDLTQMQELDVDDLLGRRPVEPDFDLLKKSIENKVILVTGAGGSIGGELCRQICIQKPFTLLLVDQSEFALYKIHQDLEAFCISLDQVRLVPLLASVHDEAAMRKIMIAWRPDCIYHAAAYKHVPLVEHNPTAGIRNNVFGTLILAQLAHEVGVTNFVLVSTDKAVRPTNIMGASKRLSEMVLQAFSRDSKYSTTKFSMVRFGNVLDSSGSVVPKFRKQLRMGGPLTVTHKEVTRYFMTTIEASQLVLQAGAMADGGEVFLLDMGAPIKIMDLAIRMIRLSGYGIRNQDNPEGEIEIEIVGLRPGEKLYEELLIGNNPLPTAHPRIMKSREEYLPLPDLIRELDILDALLTEANHDGLRDFLCRTVRGYQPNKKIVDWLFLEKF